MQCGGQGNGGARSRGAEHGAEVRGAVRRAAERARERGKLGSLAARPAAYLQTAARPRQSDSCSVRVARPQQRKADTNTVRLRHW